VSPNLIISRVNQIADIPIKLRQFLINSVSVFAQTDRHTLTYSARNSICFTGVAGVQMNMQTDKIFSLVVKTETRSVFSMLLQTRHSLKEILIYGDRAKPHSRSSFQYCKQAACCADDLAFARFVSC